MPRTLYPRKIKNLILSLLILSDRIPSREARSSSREACLPSSREALSLLGEVLLYL